MAKGKGKGYGKGRDDDGNSGGNCCGCICCCLLLPPILLAVGVFILTAGNNRVERIEEYNTRAQQWVSKGMEAFKGAKFTYEKTPLDMMTTKTGKYYPVSDSCSKEGDPEEKCVYTEALFYQTYAQVSSSSSYTTITLKADNEELVSRKFANQQTTYYTASELGCTKDKSKCSSKCHNKGGEWDSSSQQCTVTHYLNSVCYRVKKVGTSYKLDVPPTWPLSGSDAGCYYSTDYHPAMYSSNRLMQIPVAIRYYQDSYISADEFTHGCSSTSPSSTSCFGMSRKEQNKLGLGIAGVGAFLLIIEVGLVVFMCICCRDTITGVFGKKKRGLLQSDENATYNASIPTAQPAQPAYMPAQPTQPSYMPAQPAQPAQPSYMPAQPSYMPAYMPAQPAQPIQPGYIPYNPQQY